MSKSTALPESSAEPEVPLEDEDNISRDAALQLLGVKKETLYTYVSRGWIRSFPSNEGRAHVFARADVERLRAKSLARSGIGAVAETVMRYGEPVITSRISEITLQGPRYRGRLAVDLADQGCTFEAVASWLWTGVWLEDRVCWNDVPEFQPPPVTGLSDGGTCDIVKTLAGVVLALGVAPPGPEQFKLGTTLDAARQIIQILTGMLGLLSSKRKYIAVLAGKPLAASIHRILGRAADPEAIAALNAMMVLCADYELSPASFTARVVASSGADLYASVAAGLCAHSGLLTGHICDRLTELLSGGARNQNQDRRLNEIRKFGATLYGFNPALAPDGDPRAYWMIKQARALLPRAETPVLQNMLRFLDRIEADLDLHPGLPAGLVTLTAALGLPSKSAVAVWGIARTAGQIAHVIEQREAGFVLRPRAMFVLK
ncbi:MULTISPECIES: citrate/2-methylcitrate synthase [unclassified Pigmentiphaga]|uniref:citrate/2-methylcitrate synthase n=1 Tax=unclassified Pigmentiphaga TaxID=2626614 RepID=UPI0014046326|nr:MULTISPECIES: citrate/2-methylcitrate synthase [unclassified Pigmentiphaga]